MTAPSGPPTKRRTPRTERREAGSDESDPRAEPAPAVPERRRYNRRSAAPAVSPPYYETFERIALALERIAQHLDQRQVRMPDTPLRRRSPADGS